MTTINARKAVHSGARPAQSVMVVAMSSRAAGRGCCDLSTIQFCVPDACKAPVPNADGLIATACLDGRSILRGVPNADGLIATACLDGRPILRGVAGEDAAASGGATPGPRVVARAEAAVKADPLPTVSCGAVPVGCMALRRCISGVAAAEPNATDVKLLQRLPVASGTLSACAASSWCLLHSAVQCRADDPHHAALPRPSSVPGTISAGAASVHHGAVGTGLGSSAGAMLASPDSVRMLSALRDRSHELPRCYGSSGHSDTMTGGLAKAIPVSPRHLPPPGHPLP